ncbi:hypothetical protein TNCV_2898811 [Trichonephila clavipes]|nr:hypothetical protein TNCV_2898811 [Trichonephila clavipes]
MKSRFSSLTTAVFQCLLDHLTPILPVLTDSLISRLFVESSALEHGVPFHSGMAVEWADRVSSHTKPVEVWLEYHDMRHDLRAWKWCPGVPRVSANGHEKLDILADQVHRAILQFYPDDDGYFMNDNSIIYCAKSSEYMHIAFPKKTSEV